MENTQNYWTGIINELYEIYEDKRLTKSVVEKAIETLGLEGDEEEEFIGELEAAIACTIDDLPEK